LVYRHRRRHHHFVPKIEWGQFPLYDFPAMI
jgi:hypothetical protein